MLKQIKGYFEANVITLAPLWKFIFTSVLISYAWAVEFAATDDATYGATAAMLAMGAAAALFIGLIPSKDNLVNLFNSLVAAGLTLWAGWNWLMDETDGMFWPTFEAAFYLMVVIAIPLIIGVLRPVATNKKQEDKG